jgi:hypothetical protein
VMLDDGARARGAEVRVRDVAQLLASATRPAAHESTASGSG